MTKINSFDDERRQSFRIDMEKELVELIWFDENNKTQQRKIVCLNFSRGGLKLDCDQSISVSTNVDVLFNAIHPNSQKLCGQVIRCVQNESGWYHIALQLNQNGG